jgi:hypothetical protein
MLTAQIMSKSKRKQKCKTCAGNRKVSMCGFAAGHAVMPMVTCMACDGTGEQGAQIKRHVSPDRMADGRETIS